MGSSSLTRDHILVPCLGTSAFATGPPGKSWGVPFLEERGRDTNYSGWWTSKTLTWGWKNVNNSPGLKLRTQKNENFPRGWHHCLSFLTGHTGPSPVLINIFFSPRIQMDVCQGLRRLKIWKPGSKNPRQDESNSNTGLASIPDLFLPRGGLVRSPIQKRRNTDRPAGTVNILELKE